MSAGKRKRSSVSPQFLGYFFTFVEIVVAQPRAANKRAECGAYGHNANEAIASFFRSWVVLINSEEFAVVVWRDSNFDSPATFLF